MRTTHKQAVLRGAALLDTVDPQWFTRVDTSILDMSSGVLCVIGQAYGGDFSDAIACDGALDKKVQKAGLTVARTPMFGDIDAYYYGFDSSVAGQVGDTDHRQLRDWWIYEAGGRKWAAAHKVKVSR